MNMRSKVSEVMTLRLFALLVAQGENVLARAREAVGLGTETHQDSKNGSRCRHSGRPKRIFLLVGTTVVLLRW